MLLEGSLDCTGCYLPAGLHKVWGQAQLETFLFKKETPHTNVPFWCVWPEGHLLKREKTTDACNVGVSKCEVKNIPCKPTQILWCPAKAWQWVLERQGKLTGFVSGAEAWGKAAGWASSDRRAPCWQLKMAKAGMEEGQLANVGSLASAERRWWLLWARGWRSSGWREKQERDILLPPTYPPTHSCPPQPCAPRAGPGWEGCLRSSRRVEEGRKLPRWSWPSPWEVVMKIRVAQASPLNVTCKLSLLCEEFDPKTGCTMATLCSGSCGWDQTQAASLEVSIFPVSYENTQYSLPAIQSILLIAGSDCSVIL